MPSAVWKGVLCLLNTYQAGIKVLFKSRPFYVTCYLTNPVTVLEEHDLCALKVFCQRNESVIEVMWGFMFPNSLASSGIVVATHPSYCCRTSRCLHPGIHPLLLSPLNVGCTTFFHVVYLVPGSIFRAAFPVFGSCVSTTILVHSLPSSVTVPTLHL